MEPIIEQLRRQAREYPLRQEMEDKSIVDKRFEDIAAAILSLARNGKTSISASRFSPGGKSMSNKVWAMLVDRFKAEGFTVECENWNSGLDVMKITWD